MLGWEDGDGHMQWFLWQLRDISLPFSNPRAAVAFWWGEAPSPHGADIRTPNLPELAPHCPSLGKGLCLGEAFTTLVILFGSRANPRVVNGICALSRSLPVIRAAWGCSSNEGWRNFPGC